MSTKPARLEVNMPMPEAFRDPNDKSAVSAVPEVRPIAAGHAKPTESVNVSHTVYAPDSVTVEDMLGSRLWMIVGRRFNLHDEVRVIQQSRWSLLLVTQASIAGVKMALLMTAPLEKAEPIPASLMPAGYEIRPAEAGERTRYAVYRLSDGVFMNKNLAHDTEEQARTWLLNSAVFRAQVGPVRRA